VEDDIIAARRAEDGVVDGTSEAVEAEIVAVAEDKVSTAEEKRMPWKLVIPRKQGSCQSCWNIMTDKNKKYTQLDTIRIETAQ
jgi:hypothetical protein